MTARPGRLAPLSAAARTDANGTMWRLRSLVAMGHDCARIARALHVPARPGPAGRPRPGPHRHLRVPGRRLPALGRLVGQDPAPAAPRPSGAPPPARCARPKPTTGPPPRAWTKTQLDAPGYRPWCRYRPATGTGPAPDFPPARPRPLHTREIA